jgi:hypothetical protein
MEQNRTSPVRFHHYELARQAPRQPSGDRPADRLDQHGNRPEVCCEIDGNLYPEGIKVPDQEMQAINTSRHEFHSEWNYTISSIQQPP